MWKTREYGASYHMSSREILLKSAPENLLYVLLNTPAKPLDIRHYFVTAHAVPFELPTEHLILDKVERPQIEYDTLDPCVSSQSPVWKGKAAEYLT